MSASQTLTVLSNEDVARRDMLGLKRTSVIKAECSSSVVFGFKESVFHNTACHIITMQKVLDILILIIKLRGLKIKKKIHFLYFERKIRHIILNLTFKKLVFKTEQPQQIFGAFRQPLLNISHSLSNFLHSPSYHGHRWQAISHPMKSGNRWLCLCLLEQNLLR